MEDWKVVFISSELYMAEMAQQMLKDNGIEAVVVDKKDSAYPVIGHVDVMVEPGKQAAAEKLIKDFES